MANTDQSQAAALKKFTQKAGYEKALDFDPVNGIVKFGAYEAFVTDLGIKPTRQEYNFKDYLKATAGIGSTATREFAYLSAADKEKQLRESFERDVMAGTVPAVPKSNQYTGVAIQRENRTGPIGAYGNTAPAPASYRKVTKLGPDSFAVDTYAIPDDQTAGYNLLNDISSRASNMSKQLRSGTYALRQNQQDSRLRRQGAASTILSGTAAATAINT